MNQPRLHPIPADLQFYISTPHECSYLPEHEAVTLFPDPLFPLDPMLYSTLAELGFRRSGDHVYRPRCPGCSACQACRVPVSQFRPNRSQRRNLKRNADLEITVIEGQFLDEHYALYSRYLAARHADGTMAEHSEDDYRRFLLSNWMTVELVEFRHQGRLLAVSVIDVLVQGLSAVYTFFDPDANERGLGVFAVLSLIDLCQQRGLPALYLGYYIAASDKMNYKARYQPLEVLGGDGLWHPLTASEEL